MADFICTTDQHQHASNGSTKCAMLMFHHLVFGCTHFSCTCILSRMAGTDRSCQSSFVLCGRAVQYAAPMCKQPRRRPTFQALCHLWRHTSHTCLCEVCLPGVVGAMAWRCRLGFARPPFPAVTLHHWYCPAQGRPQPPKD